jgi:hypothetical protein
LRGSEGQRITLACVVPVTRINTATEVVHRKMCFLGPALDNAEARELIHIRKTPRQAVLWNVPRKSKCDPQPDRLPRKPLLAPRAGSQIDGSGPPPEGPTNPECGPCQPQLAREQLLWLALAQLAGDRAGSLTS